MHSAYVVVEFSNDGLPERPAVAISAFPEVAQEAGGYVFFSGRELMQYEPGDS